MGLFGGFFNYSKPGPGIEKDAPKKATFFLFFETWFRNIWKLVVPSLVYCLMSVFLLPFGLASVGITNITRNLSRDKHSFGISDFFSTIKKNWKQALPIGIINIIATALLVFAIWFYYKVGGTLYTLFAACSLSMFVLFSMMKYYIWIITITFDLKIGTIYKNSFLMAFLNFKNNLLIGFVSILYFVVMYGIFYMVPSDFTLTLLLIFTVCFYPGFKNLLIQYCVFGAVKKYMIDPYYKANPGADIAVRRSLGLEIFEEENIEEDSEGVFSDSTNDKNE